MDLSLQDARNTFRSYFNFKSYWPLLLCAVMHLNKIKYIFGPNIKNGYCYPVYPKKASLLLSSCPIWKKHHIIHKKNLQNKRNWVIKSKFFYKLYPANFDRKINSDADHFLSAILFIPRLEKMYNFVMQTNLGFRKILF